MHYVPRWKALDSAINKLHHVLGWLRVPQPGRVLNRSLLPGLLRPFGIYFLYPLHSRLLLPVDNFGYGGRLLSGKVHKLSRRCLHRLRPRICVPVNYIRR